MGITNPAALATGAGEEGVKGKDLGELVKVLEAPKRLSGLGKWKPINQKAETGAGLEIRGVVEIGVSFRAQCNPALPEENVSLMLFTETEARPRCFSRIDWRGSKHDNTNKALTGKYWGQSAGRTHFHDPRLHLHIDFKTLFATPGVDLPIATEILPEPSSFQLLLAESAILLRIDNLGELPDPPWPATRSLF
ncbi:MAG: hypothetical protein ACEPO2_07300 [Pelagibaca sp.]